ncbi:MAG: NAD(P)-dependent oxidoreductase [Bacteroidales bacterium]
MRVLVATDKPFAAIAIQGIRKSIEAAGDELVLLEKYTEKSQLLEAIRTVDAVIVRSDIIDAEVINHAEQLKIIVRAGAGYDNIDLEAAKARGICVMNTPGQNANAVAELVFGMILYKIRNHFDGTSGTELMGKSLGLHAYGNVARNVARIARCFGMTIYAFDPFCPKEVIHLDGVIALDSAEKLYQKCQYVSLHMPATADTRKSINHALLSQMPKNAMLINTARKEVIHEEELLSLMDERKDFSYVSDITPDHADTFIEKYNDRVLFTPKKMGAQTAEANINAGIAAANQIVGFLKNGIDKFRVN